MAEPASDSTTSLVLQTVISEREGPSPRTAPKFRHIKISVVLWLGHLIAATLYPHSAIAQSFAQDNAEIAAQEQLYRAEREQGRRSMLAQAARRSRAHSRPQTQHPLGVSGPICPVLGTGSARPGTLWVNNPTSPLARARFAPAHLQARATAKPTEPVSSYFSQHISQQVVQSKCISCHVEAGMSRHTRIVLAPASSPNHETKNFEVFRSFIVNVENGADTILNKIRGVAHGGGIQVFAGSADFFEYGALRSTTRWPSHVLRLVAGDAVRRSHDGVTGKDVATCCANLCWQTPDGGRTRVCP